MFRAIQIEKEALRVKIENNKGQVTPEDHAKFEGPKLNIRPDLGNPVFLDDIDREMRLGKAVPTVTLQAQGAAKQYFGDDDSQFEERKVGRSLHDDTVQAP